MGIGCESHHRDIGNWRWRFSHKLMERLHSGWWGRGNSQRGILNWLKETLFLLSDLSCLVDLLVLSEMTDVVRAGGRGIKRPRIVKCIDGHKLGQSSETCIHTSATSQALFCLHWSSQVYCSPISYAVSCLPKLSGWIVQDYWRPVLSCLSLGVFLISLVLDTGLSLVDFVLWKLGSCTK